MTNKLISYLVYEKKLLDDLITLADRQQTALIKYDINVLEQISAYQEELSKKLREAEEQRIKLLMAWLGITRAEAVNMKLSAIEKKFQKDELIEIRHLRRMLKKSISELYNLNTSNRVLANRARNSVQTILSIFTNGSNHVYNVRV